MTVAELIAKLRDFPPELPVLHSDFEYGLSEPSIAIERHTYPESWNIPTPRVVIGGA